MENNKPIFRLEKMSFYSEDKYVVPPNSDLDCIEIDKETINGISTQQRRKKNVEHIASMFSNVPDLTIIWINSEKGTSNLKSIYHAPHSTNNKKVKSCQKCMACQSVNSFSNANAKTCIRKQ